MAIIVQINGALHNESTSFFALNELLEKLSLKGFYLGKCIIVKNES
jgi:hypothetical protein